MMLIGLDRISRALQAAPVGTWFRGGAWGFVQVASDDAGKGNPPPTKEELTFAVPLSPTTDDLEFYTPLVDEPGAYLRFAEYGDWLWGKEFDRDLADQKALDLLHEFGLLWDLQHSKTDYPSLANIWAESKLLSMAVLCHRVLIDVNDATRTENEVEFWRRYGPELREPNADPHAVNLEAVNPFLRQAMLEQDFIMNPDVDNLPPPHVYRDIGGSWLRQTLNDQLRVHQVMGQVIFNPPERWARGVLISSLAAALWVQLEVAVIERSAVKNCAHCKRLFDTDNAGRVYCTDRCRSAASSAKYRKKAGTHNA